MSRVSFITSLLTGWMWWWVIDVDEEPGFRRHSRDRTCWLAFRLDLTSRLALLLLFRLVGGPSVRILIQGRPGCWRVRLLAQSLTKRLESDLPPTFRVVRIRAWQANGDCCWGSNVVFADGLPADPQSNEDVVHSSWADVDGRLQNGWEETENSGQCETELWGGLHQRDVPGEREIVGHIATGSVAMPLVEAEVEPSDDHPRREHGRVGSFQKADQIEDDRQERNGERDITIGHLAQWCFDHNVVRHHLLHGYRNGCNVAWQAVDVHLCKEELDSQWLMSLSKDKLVPQTGHLCWLWPCRAPGRRMCPQMPLLCWPEWRMLACTIQMLIRGTWCDTEFNFTSPCDPREAPAACHTGRWWQDPLQPPRSGIPQSSGWKQSRSWIRAGKHNQV